MNIEEMALWPSGPLSLFTNFDCVNREIFTVIDPLEAKSATIAALQFRGAGMACRAFLTGIHLTETGTMECNLPALNAEGRLTRVGKLLERGAAGIGEWQLMDKGRPAFRHRNSTG